MRIVIIEDELAILNTIKGIVTNYIPNIEIVGTATNTADAYTCLKDTKPEIALCDVNIGEHTIFQVLERLDTIDFKIIFITAFEEYAVKAIKLSAIDYIIKPVDPLELIASLKKASNTIDRKIESQKANVLVENITANILNKVVLKTSERIVIVTLPEIIQVEADGSYSTFYLNSNRKIVVSKLLKEYDELLADCEFYRTHQSHLVNLNQVRSFEKTNGGYLLMKNGSQIPVSKRKREALLQILESF